jgi:uncharacterized lipoprotein YmbA
MTGSRVLRALLLALVASLAAGCLGRGAAPQYFTLSAGSGAAAGAPLAQRPELGLIVGPIEFPRYLDRPEIVTRDGSHRLLVSDANRWGGSLRNDILRVVADDLGRLLGTARVVVYPTEPRFPALYRVLLDVRELEGVSGAQVALRVRWTIAEVRGGRALAVEETQLEQPLTSASYDELVAAESAALGALTHQIAQRLAALPAGP